MTLWNAGDRVTREWFLDDGTWAKEGDSCLPNSPLMHGVIAFVDGHSVWVRWDHETGGTRYLNHGISKEVVS